jgi:hypothetical protein
MPGPLTTAADIRRHVTLKRDLGELREGVAARMLAALDAGDAPDYQLLLRAAMFPDPPATVFHTAPASWRGEIATTGLRVSQPGQGGSWAPNKAICVMLQAAQPPGVYVCAAPDLRGVWSHWPAWDVWAVQRRSLPWAHDKLNPGCWSLRADVPPDAIRLHARCGEGQSEKGCASA